MRHGASPHVRILSAWCEYIMHSRRVAAMRRLASGLVVHFSALRGAPLELAGGIA